MTWAEYYDKFYDWSESTRISRLSRLTDFGSSSEICEIAQELFEDKLAQRLIKKALAAGVRFQPDEIMDMAVFVDKPTLSKLVETAAVPLSREQLEELHMLIDDATFEKASKRAKIDIFADEDEPEEVEMDSFEVAEEQQPKVGFFTALALGLGIAGHMDKKKSHKHNGKCNGDCANCPAHYGYRYGRWYYGHHHTHGCEFGGNNGNGGL